MEINELGAMLGGLIIVTKDKRAFRLTKEQLDASEIRLNDKPIGETEHFERLLEALDGYYFSHTDNLLHSKEDPSQPYVVYLADDTSVDGNVYQPTISNAAGEFD